MPGPVRTPQLRVALLGVADPFAGAAATVEAATLDQVPTDTALMLVDADTAHDHARELRRLRRRHDVTVAVVGDPGRRRVADLRLAFTATATGDDDVVAVAPAVDPTRANPVGWRRWAKQPAVAVITRQGPVPDDSATLATTLDDDLRVLVGPGVDRRALPGPLAERVATGVSDGDDLLDRVRRFRVLVDDPRWHDGPDDECQLLLRVAATGTPVVTTSDVPRRSGLPGTATDVAGRVRELLTDDALRERVSVRGRRTVLHDHTGQARLDAVLAAAGATPSAPPRVSVVLATNRPDQLAHAVAGVVRQRHPDVELVAVLHGDGFDDLAPLERVGGPVQVVRAGAELTLGACLNLGVESASGELVAKMDDDDHYGRDHLGDLVLALGYSRADLVGKRIEHVHLADRDVTVTRPQSNVERDRDHVSGPTLLAPRALLRELPFLDVPRRVDSTLHERLRAAGRRIYATHALDVVLERRGAGHTWQADTDAMLAEAVVTSPGLDLRRTASDPDAFAPA